MPIDFEPAAPAATNASVGYGAAEQSAKDLPTMASIYAQAAQLNQHGQLAGLAAQQQGQQAAMQGQLQDKGLQQQQYGHDQQTALGYAQMQQHSADLDRHAQNQAWLQQQDLSAKEVMHLNQMRNAIGEVMANDKLDDDTKNDLLFKIRTDIDPLDRRQKQQQIKHQQQQDQLIDMQLQREASHRATQAEFEARMMTGGQNWAWYPDDNGKRHPLVQNPKTGFWYNPLLANAGDKGGGGGGGPGGGDTFKQETATRKEWQAAHKDATSQVSAWMKGTADPKGPGSPEFDQAVDALMTKRGFGADLNGYVNARLGRNPQQPAAAAGQSQPDPAAARAEVAKRNPPFDIGKPDAATPEQQDLVRSWTQVKADRIAGIGDPAARASYEQNADLALSLLARFGSRAGMPDDAGQQYDAIKTALRGLPVAQKPAPDLSPREQLNRGELVKGPDVVAAARKLNRGELIAAPEVQAKVKDALRKFDRGELVTVDDLRSLLAPIISASPFNRR